MASSSFALNVANLAGIPKSVMDRAKVKTAEMDKNTNLRRDKLLKLRK
jgi:DNA mismatch repair ATPase MutS